MNGKQSVKAACLLMCVGARKDIGTIQGQHQSCVSSWLNNTPQQVSPLIRATAC